VSDKTRYSGWLSSDPPLCTQSVEADDEFICGCIIVLIITVTKGKFSLAIGIERGTGAGFVTMPQMVWEGRNFESRTEIYIGRIV
jgi:hypothetical protein